MTLPMLEAWLLPLRASIGAGEAAWFEYAKAWGFGEHGSKPLVEPSWTTVHAIQLELPSMRLRDFTREQARRPATLVVAPFALHGATIADFAPRHSLIEALQQAGVSPLHLVECKSATPSMRYFSIDTYLADLNVIVDELGGNVNLIGLCQGGWLSLTYAARFPAKVIGLVLVGSPIDTDAAPSRFVEAARKTDLATFEEIIHAGDGRLLGQAVMALWGVDDLGWSAVADVLQTDLTHELFERFGNWHRWTVDLPGGFYLEVVQQVFRENQLVKGRFKALGQVVELKAVQAPLYLLASEADEVTPPEQLFNIRQRVGSPREQVMTVMATGSHLSLFLGANTVGREWRRIGNWIVQLNAKRPLLMSLATGLSSNPEGCRVSRSL